MEVLNTPRERNVTSLCCIVVMRGTLTAQHVPAGAGCPGSGHCPLPQQPCVLRGGPVTRRPGHPFSPSASGCCHCQF